MGILGGIKNFLFGGNATKGLDPRLQHGGYIAGQLQDAIGGLGNRQAPQVGPAAQLAAGPQDQVRQQQLGQTGFLSQIMSGTAPGAGELAVNRQANQASAAQIAAARGVRGSNAALAARQAARNIGDLRTNAAGQASIAQMQDQQSAAGQLGQSLAGIRGQDIGLAGQNAQLQQAQQLANLDAQLKMTGMNDAARQQYLAQLLGLDTAQYQNELAKRGLASQDKGMLGGLLQTAGTIGAAYAGK